MPDYVGPFRDGTALCATENHVIPAFLEMVFNRPQNGWRGSETYLRGARVNNGVLDYKHGEHDHA